MAGVLLFHDGFHQAVARGVDGGDFRRVVALDQAHFHAFGHDAFQMLLQLFHCVARQQAAVGDQVARSGRMLAWSLPLHMVTAVVVRVMALSCLLGCAEGLQLFPVGFPGLGTVGPVRPG